MEKIVATRYRAIGMRDIMTCVSKVLLLYRWVDTIPSRSWCIWGLIRQHRRPPRVRSSAASDGCKRQEDKGGETKRRKEQRRGQKSHAAQGLALIHIPEPTRPYSVSYAVFFLKKKKKSISESVG